MKRKNLVLFSVAVVLITAIFLLFKNELRKVGSVNYFSYKLNERILINQNVNLTNKSQLIIDKNNNQFILRILANRISIIDVDRDSVVREFYLDRVKIQSFDAPDTNNFVILTDSSFIQYRNTSFREIKFHKFNDDFIPVKHSRIVYCAELNEVYSIAVPMNFNYKKLGRYNHKFINVYNLNNLSSNPLDIKYPKTYQINDLGIPRPFLTKSDSLVIISFEFDENIHTYNFFKKDKIKSIKFVSSSSKLKESLPQGLNKAEKVDAIISLSRYNDGYGPAFYDDKKKRFLRIYRPDLPLKDKNGDFYSSSDVGCNLIILKNRQIKEYKFPNGVYFVYRNWKFNSSNSSLTYLKIYNPNDKKKVWKYSVHNIYPFDF